MEMKHTHTRNMVFGTQTQQSQHSMFKEASWQFRTEILLTLTEYMLIPKPHVSYSIYDKLTFTLILTRSICFHFTEGKIETKSDALIFSRPHRF